MTYDGLAKRHIIDFENRQRSEWSSLLHLHIFRTLQTSVFEINAGGMKKDPNEFSSSGGVEIDEFMHDVAFKNLRFAMVYWF
jgi:hypothetical protein